MEIYRVAATELNPTIICDPAANTFLIEGKSIADDSEEFYRPLIQWMKDYCKDPKPATTFTIKLEYCNTASSRSLFDVFKLMETIPNPKIVWMFVEDDEDVEEAGQELEELVSVPFEFRAE